MSPRQESNEGFIDQNFVKNQHMDKIKIKTNTVFPKIHNGFTMSNIYFWR